MDISWLKANPATIFTNGDWMLSQSRTASSRRDDHTMLGKAKPTHRKSNFVAHNARKRCIKKNFDGIHDRFQRDPVFRDSQLKIGWTEKKCMSMDKLAQEDHSYCPLPEEFERYRKNWYITLNKSGRNAPMKLFLSTSIRNGIRRLLHPVPHSGTGIKTGGAHKFKVNNL